MHYFDRAEKCEELLRSTLVNDITDGVPLVITGFSPEGEELSYSMIILMSDEDGRLESFRLRPHRLNGDMARILPSLKTTTDGWALLKSCVIL
jgi:hypothetical protein